IQITPQPSLSGINHSIIGLTFNFTGVGTPNTTNYYWNFGDGVTDSSSNNSISHTYSSAGNYTVTLIAYNECGSDTITKNIVITNIQELSEVDVSLFPNPADDKIYVQAKDITEIV